MVPYWDMKMTDKKWFWGAVCVVVVMCFGLAWYAKRYPRLVIYTTQPREYVAPLFEAYTQKTGIKISYLILDRQGLVKRLQMEGNTTPADLVFGADAIQLSELQRLGFLQPGIPESVEEAVPPSFREEKGYWFGYASSVRTAVYHSRKVSSDHLSTYLDLALPEWKGRVMLGSMRLPQSHSLLGMMVYDRGEPEASAIVSGWVENAVLPICPDDRCVLAALESGKGDVGIVDTAVFGQYQRENPKSRLRVFFLDQPVLGGRGVHVSITGVGMLAYSRHPQAVQAFFAWLVTPEAQSLWASLTEMFPMVVSEMGSSISTTNVGAKPSVPTQNPVTRWGVWYRNPMPMSAHGAQQEAVRRIVEGAGYE